VVVSRNPRDLDLLKEYGDGIIPTSCTKNPDKSNCAEDFCCVQTMVALRIYSP
jgi:hypothetical protein